ncbi:hypothetical protein AB664_17620 [Brucella anthropi]|uniref:Uncharacterized protein n=1 Tax=Brucella anthropi TaxID=529 RepID=A0A656Z2J4_BRUAN|nr:hypothetical protein AB664_17620 [Brucella anthropi]
MRMLKDIAGLITLAAQLLWRFWPQLLLTGTVGLIARELLLQGAVRAGFYAPLAGMIVLSLVVLVKLLVVVVMLNCLRPALPALAKLRGSVASVAARGRRTANGSALCPDGCGDIAILCLLCRLGISRRYNQGIFAPCFRTTGIWRAD